MASDQEPNRKPGTFQKGQSGNPGGRPKADFRLRELARAQTENAIATLVRCMEDSEAPWPARVSASSVILDRGWGKATQPIEGEGEDGALVIEIVKRTYADHPSG